VKIGGFDTDRRVLIVAEIGNNHEGDFALAEKLVVRAAESGADAVKVQTIVPELLVSPLEQERVEQLRRFQFSYEEFVHLGRTARREGLLYISTPFDLTSVDALEEHVDAFKVASGDNTFYPLLSRICRTGKPLVVSSGLTDWRQIKHVHDYILARRSRATADDLAFLHCVCAYPVPAADANLAVIGTLKQLGVTVGYSDHTLGIEAAVLSVAAGARIVEKHFTIDKEYSSFRDHQLSADPADLEEMVRRIREAECLLGCHEKRLLECERSLRTAVRRSIVAAQDLSKGHRLTREDLIWTRPGGGLAPGGEDELVGRVLAERLPAGTAIRPGHFCD